VIGYDKASAISHKADDEGTSLRDAALALGVSAADFDRIVQPKTDGRRPAARPRIGHLRQQHILSGLPASLAHGLVERRRLSAAAGHATALAIACLTSYWLATDILSKVHSLSRSDELVGGLWCVIATIFVYRETHRESVTAALNRASGTLVSFGLCLIYLFLFSFHPWAWPR
jgi:fumarase hydratase-like protein